MENINFSEKEKDMLKELEQLKFDIVVLGHEDGSKYNRIGEILEYFRVNYSIDALSVNM